MARILFLVIAAFGLLAALGTVLSRNLVHAALHLIGFFVCIAAMFVMLDAEFLAVVQVLVYVGAVAIILMFGIMLTRSIKGDDPTLVGGRWPIGLGLGLATFAALAFGINNAVAPSGPGPWSGVSTRSALVPAETEPSWAAERRGAIDDMARVVGIEFVTRYAMAFELAGLLLTAALVGAVALAHREEASATTFDDAPGTSDLQESVGSSAV